MIVKSLYMKKLWIGLISLALFSACEGLERSVELDLDQTETKYVIEGMITNEMTEQMVKVSKTGGYYDAENPPLVSGAVVEVRDDAGNSYSFTEKEGEKGTYIAQFQGIVGRTYSLKVSTEGRLFEASEKMIFLTSIDSLSYAVDPEEQADPDEDEPDRFYDVLLFVKEPQETEDYYYFRFFRNGKEENYDNREVYYSDDKLLQENIDGIEFPSFYAKGDTAEIEMFSITRSAFIFYSDLAQALSNDGGIFGPIPANLRNNLTNGALGYFQVSAVSRKTIIVDP